MGETGKTSDGDLLDQLIHDLKNPLGVMLSFAEEIPNAAEDDRSEFCNRLVANARRAIQVLDDFALLRDLRQQSVRLRRTACDFAELVAAALSSVLEGDGAPSLTVPKGGAGVRVDVPRLRHAVEALVRETVHRMRRSDAVRFRLEGDAATVALRLGVSGRHEEDPEGYPFDVETVAFELARRVAAAHGGALRFETRRDSASAVLSLPRARSGER